MCTAALELRLLEVDETLLIEVDWQSHLHVHYECFLLLLLELFLDLLEIFLILVLLLLLRRYRGLVQGFLGIC